MTISRWMYGVSLASSFGLTTNCWMIAGYRPPIRIAESTSSPNPTAGSIALRRAAPAKNSRAHRTAITARTVLAGSTALTSVYEAPVVTAPRWEKSMPYRSTQYATAFSSTKTPNSTNRCACAAIVTRGRRPCMRSPPYR